MTDWLATLGTVALLYAVHSTLILGLVTLLTWRIAKSPADRERIWKWGALIPFVTVPLSFLFPVISLWPSGATEIGFEVVQPAPAGAYVSPPEVTDETFTSSSASLNLIAGDIGLNSDDPVNAAGIEDWQITIAPGPSSGAGSVKELPVNDTGELPAVIPLTADESLPIAVNEQPSPPALQPAGWKWSITQRVVLISSGFIALLCLAIGLIRTARDTVLLQFSLSHTKLQTTGPVYQQLQSLRKRYGVRKNVDILLSCSCVEPAACGIWQWRILIPEELAQTLPKEQMRALLSHELGHLVRRDPLWLAVGRLLTGCFPWQPLNWFAFRQWRIAEEFLADAWALDHGVQPLTLARCLTDVADWRIHGPVCPGVPASATQLSERVAFLASESPSLPPATFRSRLIPLASALLIILMLPRPTLQSSQLGNVEASPTFQAVDQSEAAINSNGELLIETAAVNADREALLAVEQDLQRALQLLADQESDPEVQSLVESLKSRCTQLRKRLRDEQRSASGFNREIKP